MTPQEVVTAVQLGNSYQTVLFQISRFYHLIRTGLNLDWGFAVFVTWGALLVDGNLLTNLMSLGPKSNQTGPDPPAPAIVGGLNAHAVFEGIFPLNDP